MNPGILPRLARLGARSRLALALLLLCLGCTPPPKTPTPEHVRVAVAPSAAPLVRQLGDLYHARHSYATVETFERSADGALKAVAGGEADLAVIEHALDPADALDPQTGKPHLRAWPLATGAIAVVVNPANPVEDVTADALRQAFGGVERRWTGLGGVDRTVQLVSREPEAPLRLVFEREVLQGTRLAGSAVVMPSDQDVADYVAAHPEALGYLSAAWAGAGVKAVAIDGARPEPTAVVAGYPLTYPLVIVAPTALSGKAKSLIDFALSEEGQAVVAQSYGPPGGQN